MSFSNNNNNNQLNKQNFNQFTGHAPFPQSFNPNPMNQPQFNQNNNNLENLNLQFNVPNFNANRPQSQERNQTMLTPGNNMNIAHNNEPSKKPKLTVKLNNQEKTVYTQYLNKLDPSNTGKIKARDLVPFFKCSGLSVDVLKKIWLIASSNNEYLDKNEFFVALRLVAYAQNNIPIELESIIRNIETAMPKFIPPQKKEMEKPKETNSNSNNQNNNIGQVLDSSPTVAAQLNPSIHPGTNSSMNNPNKPQNLNPSNNPSFNPNMNTKIISNAYPYNNQNIASKDGSINNGMTSSITSNSNNNTQGINMNDLRKNSANQIQKDNMGIQEQKIINDKNDIIQANLTNNNSDNIISNSELMNNSISSNSSQYTRNQPYSIPQRDINSNKKTRSEIIEETKQPDAIESSSIENQQSQSKNSGELSWEIPEDRAKQYEVYYDTFDPQRKGFISNDEALEVFRQSGLPEEILLNIWTACDTGGTGYLDKAEFIAAIHLIALGKANFNIQPKLPEELQNFLIKNKSKLPNKNQIIQKYKQNIMLKKSMNTIDNNNYNGLSNIPSEKNDLVDTKKSNEIEKEQQNNKANYGEKNEIKSNTIKHDNINLEIEEQYMKQYPNLTSINTKAEGLITYMNNTASIINQKNLEIINEQNKEINHLNGILDYYQNVLDRIQNENQFLIEQIKELDRKKSSIYSKIENIKGTIDNEIHNQTKLKQELRQKIQNIDELELSQSEHHNYHRHKHLSSSEESHSSTPHRSISPDERSNTKMNKISHEVDNLLRIKQSQQNHGNHTGGSHKQQQVNKDTQPIQNLQKPVTSNQPYNNGTESYPLISKVPNSTDIRTVIHSKANSNTNRLEMNNIVVPNINNINVPVQSIPSNRNIKDDNRGSSPLILDKDKFIITNQTNPTFNKGYVQSQWIEFDNQFTDARTAETPINK